MLYLINSVRITLHFGFFYSDSDQFRLRPMVSRSSLSEPSKARVVSASASRVCKIFEKCEFQNLYLGLQLWDLSKNRRRKTAFPVAGARISSPQYQRNWKVKNLRLYFELRQASTIPWQLLLRICQTVSWRINSKGSSLSCSEDTWT